MHKRFTDIHKWKDPWFRKLPPAYKLLWNYMCDNCDNAGVWKVDMEIASVYIGHEVVANTAADLFGQRITILREDSWFINKFVEFQFGELSSISPLHKSAIRLLEHYSLTLGLRYPSPRVQVKDKEKVKVIEREVKDVKDVKILPELPPNAFDTIWQRFPRRLGKHNAEKSFKAQVRTSKDWLDINNALDRFKSKLNKEATEEKFIPHGSTWFNNRWRDWISYEEAGNASHGGTSFSEQVAKRHREIEAEEVRKRELASK